MRLIQWPSRKTWLVIVLCSRGAGKSVLARAARDIGGESWESESRAASSVRSGHQPLELFWTYDGTTRLGKAEGPELSTLLSGGTITLDSTLDRRRLTAYAAEVSFGDYWPIAEQWLDEAVPPPGQRYRYPG